MWHEQRNGFVRVPVPKTFDRRVEQLENRDSVLFESISLPSLTPGSTKRSGRSQSAQTRPLDPVIDLSDDFMSDNEPMEPSTTPIDLQLRNLLDRVHELEAESKEKDAEIARLREELEKWEQDAPTADETSYKDQFEQMKMQYDQLREALVMEGKVRRVRAKSAHAIALVA
jgi:hypothetical protein